MWLLRRSDGEIVFCCMWKMVAIGGGDDFSICGSLSGWNELIFFKVSALLVKFDFDFLCDYQNFYQ